MEKNLNIVIALHPKGGWNIEHDGKSADRLTWDEMLGLVAQITMPEERRCCQWLKTPEQIAAWKETYGKENPGEVGIITDVDFENII
jgi:hypothetical protein